MVKKARGVEVLEEAMETNRMQRKERERGPKTGNRPKTHHSTKQEEGDTRMAGLIAVSEYF